MNPMYAPWIKSNVPDNCIGQCAEQTLRMAAAFPELKRIRGHYICPCWGKREHWWLITPENQVVDPTAKQFPSKGRGDYVPWDESKEEPTGMCPQCGGYSYNGDTTCSETCFKKYKAYLESI